jgi:hypothetical protein
LKGPQGPGFYKGGHDGQTANTLVCLRASQRCVVILANDVRAEAGFAALVTAVLGATGVPLWLGVWSGCRQVGAVGYSAISRVNTMLPRGVPP